jgi:hypothetical protein
MPFHQARKATAARRVGTWRGYARGGVTIAALLDLESHEFPLEILGHAYAVSAGGAKLGRIAAVKRTWRGYHRL